MASILSGIAVALLALCLQVAYSATVKSRYDNVGVSNLQGEGPIADRGTASVHQGIALDATEEFSLSNFVDFDDLLDIDATNKNYVRGRFKRQVDDAKDSEIFSDGPGTSLDVHSMPMFEMDDTVENADVTNKDDDANINSIDGSDDKIMENNEGEVVESKSTDEKKEVDVAPGNVDTSYSSNAGTSTEEENITDDIVKSMEETVSSDEVKTGESVKLEVHVKNDNDTNADVTNKDDDANINSIDGSDDKIMEKNEGEVVESKSTDEKKEIDVAPGNVDTSYSSNAGTSTEEENVTDDVVKSMEETVSSDEVNMGESVKLEVDVRNDNNKNSPESESEQEPAQRDEEEVNLSQGEKLAEAEPDKLQYTEEKEDEEEDEEEEVAEEDEKEEEEEEEEKEEEEVESQDSDLGEDPVQDKALPIPLTMPLAIAENVEPVRNGTSAMDEVESLLSFVKTSEESSKGDLRVAEANIESSEDDIESSGDGDDEDSAETGPEIKIVNVGDEFKNMLANRQGKHLVDDNPSTNTSEVVDFNWDYSMTADNDGDEASIHEPSANSLEDHSTTLFDEKPDLITDDEDPIPDPTIIDSEESPHLSAVDPTVNEKDSKEIDMARNMQVDELLMVPDVITTTERVEGSGLGAFDIDDSDDTSEESDTVSPFIPIQPVVAPTDVLPDPEENTDSKSVSSTERLDPVTEMPATKDSHVPDLLDKENAIEEPFVRTNVNSVNAAQGRAFDEVKDITNNDTLNESTTGTVPVGPKPVADAAKETEGINEIGLKTDEKEETAAEPNDTSISSGSFIILGAIMVAIICLLGYTVLKSHRQKQRQRDARKAKEEDPGTELKEFEKPLVPSQNGVVPANGIGETEGLLSAQADYDDINPAGLNHIPNGNTAGTDQPTRVNIPPKMTNGNPFNAANEQPAQVHNQPMLDPANVSVDMRFVPEVTSSYTPGSPVQEPSSSGGSCTSVDDRGSWVYGTTPLETTKIKVFIDEDSIPKTPIVVMKRGGETASV